MIDKNVIYKEAFEALKGVENWCFEPDVSGKEVGKFIDGVTMLTRKLLNTLEED